MAHLSSSNPWRGSRQRPGRSKGLPKISGRELNMVRVYIVLMLIAILLGMYLGWWLTMREDEIDPHANTHFTATAVHDRYLR